jgi:hypothetical protein
MVLEEEERRMQVPVILETKAALAILLRNYNDISFFPPNILETFGDQCKGRKRIAKKYSPANLKRIYRR